MQCNVLKIAEMTWTFTFLAKKYQNIIFYSKLMSHTVFKL